MYFMDANIPLKKNETVFEKLAVTKYVKTEIYFNTNYRNHHLS